MTPQTKKITAKKRSLYEVDPAESRHIISHGPEAVVDQFGEVIYGNCQDSSYLPSGSSDTNLNTTPTSYDENNTPITALIPVNDTTQPNSYDEIDFPRKPGCNIARSSSVQYQPSSSYDEWVPNRQQHNHSDDMGGLINQVAMPMPSHGFPLQHNSWAQMQGTDQQQGMVGWAHGGMEHVPAVSSSDAIAYRCFF